MIDVHILTLPDENQVWLQACLDSLKGQPVSIHLLDGIKGHVGLGRIKGFSCGESEYVSYVDPDDIVLPGAFQSCLNILAINDVELVWTAEDMLWEDKIIKTPRDKYYIHHVVVYRRKIIEQFLHIYKDYPFHGDHEIIKTILARRKFAFSGTVGYLWRVKPDGAWRKGLPPLLSRPRWSIGDVG